MARIESLLAARLFLVPQVVGNRIYFMSNLSGRLSLYVMDYGGSVPEPLLPPHIALQNPHLMVGKSYHVFDRLGKILVMVDSDGDEDYQPMLIPLEGGYPEPAFKTGLEDHRSYLIEVEDEGIVYFNSPSHKEPISTAFMGDLRTGKLTPQHRSMYGAFHAGHNRDHTKVVIGDGYTVGDNVFFLWEQGKEGVKLLYGVPLEQRAEGQEVPLNGLGSAYFVDGDKGLLVTCTIFDDKGGFGYLDLAKPGEITPVKVTGVVHQGEGELDGFDHLDGECYAVTYNIDGVSWLYEATYDAARREVRLEAVLTGKGQIASGVLEKMKYDKAGDRFALTYSTAISPTQIYTVEGEKRDQVVQHTRERVLGIADGLLSEGEDASFTSHDGLRTSARLYLPDESLGFKGPRPLVYYVHGGPQSQERPDFAWFSMPLIQLLTMKGFAVFVPNVRGSSGYGQSYMKHVDRDWGGQDRLDHVHAMTEVLPKDKRIDVKRAAVVGRSYGGYMTLTLAGRHPELWSAACDMFGPYDLFTFLERIPETWRPYFYLALGHPEKDKDFLTDRSPKTHIENMTCPMLVIQGANDPRVVEAESRDLVEHLRKKGKDIELLVFEDEGHDVIKYENRVRCYNAITDFFVKHLQP